MTENVKDFLKDIVESEKYRELGTIEEIQKMIKEEDVLKFYYCESEDEYYIGKRIDTMYYAKYSKTGFAWCMSRYLPWGEHVVSQNTLWKEHTYPSEPKEIPFFDWLQGFIEKYCLGTVEECREARERQTQKKPNLCMNEVSGMFVDYADGHGEYKTQMNNWWRCPCCNEVVGQRVIVHKHIHDQRKKKYCENCGQAISWESDAP